MDPRLKSSGINYDPFTTMSEMISTAHLDFRAEAVFSGKDVTLISPLATCGSGCRTGTMGGDPDEVVITRFAKQGRVEAKDVSFNWLVTMEDGEGLKGTVVLPPEGEMDKPPLMRLGGKMILQVQVDGEVPMRLRSRKEAVQSGAVTGWPPYGMHIDLENAPIEYFHEKDLDNPAAEPTLVVRSNRVTFGDTEALLLAVKPEITQAKLLDSNGGAWTDGRVGAVQINWTDTAPLVNPDGPPVGGYHVYRNFSPKDLAGWEFIAAVPPEQLSYTDTTVSGQAEVAYVVLHAANYSFGYKYESHVGVPMVVSLKGGRSI